METPVSETVKPETVTTPDKGTKIAVKTPVDPVKTATKPVEPVQSSTSAPVAAPVTETPATEPQKPQTASETFPSNPDEVLAMTESGTRATDEKTPDPFAVKTSSAES